MCRSAPFLATILIAACTNDVANLPLVPLPASVVGGRGALALPRDLTFSVSGQDHPALQRLVAFFGEWIDAPTLPGDANALLVLSIDESLPVREGYRLEITSDQIRVTASTEAGIFYGLQTLRQLWPGESGGTIPALVIEDEPRFGYRGMMLDVGRHMYPVAFVKKFIDMIAMHKMNTFHWHLTEDQGWRIEIKRYPRLTEVGAVRRETMLEKNFDPYVGDGIPHGGFYTQDDVRDIVAYAADRFVTVIPEIEMPGHSGGALAAYPELACTAGPFEVHTVWGVKEDIYCPHEHTFEFLENVLTEIMELFPSPYIHIGGDEAPKRRWEESEVAQSVIEREGLEDEHELQSYFIRRIERFLLEHGRRLIGWDEILEGGLAPEATVMSWRGVTGGIEAARQGHDVIMTPTSNMYLDYYQGNPESEPLAIGGFLPLEQVYAFEPVPEELTAEQGKRILGAQGNVWTEYIATSDHAEYMTFPRALAIAEIGWSQKHLRNFAQFSDRVSRHLRLMDAAGINYRIPTPEGLERDIHTLADTATVTLASTVPGANIHYTLDGTEPGPLSAQYRQPFPVATGKPVPVVTARTILANGRLGPMVRANVLHTPLLPAGDLEPADSGLLYEYFQQPSIRSIDDLDHLSPTISGSIHEIALPDRETDEKFGMVFRGFIQAPADDVYTFLIRSDDRSSVEIDGNLVVAHDGRLHAIQSGTVGLATGWHRIVVRYVQRGGNKYLEFDIERDGSPVSLPVGHS